MKLINEFLFKLILFITFHCSINDNTENKTANNDKNNTIKIKNAKETRN